MYEQIETLLDEPTNLVTGLSFFISLATPLDFLLTSLFFAYIAAELFGSDYDNTHRRSNCSKDL